MNLSGNILYIIILIFSVVIHEVAHGYAARRNGDDTAEMAGRLTLNPISHIDWLGSVILPAILLFSGSKILFGWAKPVPVNERNFTNPRRGMLEVSLSGILANFGLAIFFGLIIRFFGASLPQSALGAISIIVLVNIVLGFFNLMPIPPLDGSKALFAILPPRFGYIEEFLNRYSLIILLVFVFLAADHILGPLVGYTFGLITGMSI